MKILHVLDHSLPLQSGYAFRTAAILREQRRLGWSTVQMTGPRQGPVSAGTDRIDGIEYLRTPGGRFIGRLPLAMHLDVILRLRMRIRDMVASERPDLIHAHSPCLNGIAAMGLGPPLVYELRSFWEDAAVSTGKTREGSIRYRVSRSLETYLLRHADAVATICDGLRKDAIVRGVPAERITVIPNGVDADTLDLGRELAADEAKERWGLSGRFVLGFVGSFFAWEGIALLLEALPEIRKVRNDVAVLLVGGGDDERAIRQLACKLSMESHVVFGGFLPHEGIAEAYAAIDLLVYPRTPSRLTNLVTPLKPLEAMAMGKPLVASDVGGHRELIEDGITGLLFRAGDRRALAEAVCHLASDPGLATRLASSARRWVREQRSWAHSVTRYDAAYRRLKSGRT